MNAEIAFALSLPVLPSSTIPLLSPPFSKPYPIPTKTRRILIATLSLDTPASSSETTPQSAPPLFSHSTSFASLGLDMVFVEFLSAQHITSPSGIQSRGIPPILGGADVILGAATGSGKTLAYLLPVVQQLKNAENLRNENDPALRVARRPRAIILVPTRELADQVVSVARSLSHVAKFRVMGAVGGGSAAVPKKFNQKLSLPVDVFVSTTGRLLQLIKERSIDLRYAKHIIIDEVDTMFDAGFGPELRQIINASRGSGSRENRPQFIAVGATHPRSAQAVYDEVFPSAKTIEVDLHRPPPGLEQRFIEVGRGNKVQELVALLGDAKKDGSLRGGRMMVFCNTMDSVRFVDHFLTEAGYQTKCIHGDVPSSAREEAYEKFRNRECQVLVCSDMAARGLDNLAVEHVVLFDFPTSAVDYLHRAGRTARAGAKGRVTSFVTKRDVGLARAIEKAGSGRNDTLESARIAREAESIRRKREQDALRERREMLLEEQAQVTEDSGGGGGGGGGGARGSRRFGNGRRSAGRGRGGRGGRGGRSGRGRRRSG